MSAVTTPAQDAPLVSPATAFNPVRLLVISVAVTAVAVVAAAARSHALLGAFFGLGMALGLVNALLVRRSVTSITAREHPLKSKMAVDSAARLLIISVIALVVTLLFLRHGGLGVVVGLAAFQVILVLSTIVPVVKKLRTQVQFGPDDDGVKGTAIDD